MGFSTIVEALWGTANIDFDRSGAAFFGKAPQIRIQRGGPRQPNLKGLLLCPSRPLFIVLSNDNFSP
jgi:hypothetical protein